MLILIVEDDPAIVRFLQRGLALNPNTPADVLDRLSRSVKCSTR